MKKIINIGCRYYKNDKEKLGGVVVLFEQWVKFCNNLDSNKYLIKNIDSNKSNYKNKIIAIIKIIRIIIKELKNNKSETIIFLHSTLFDILVILPIIELITIKYPVKLCVRKFAGSFKETYNKYPSIIQKYIKYILNKTDITFWESKYLVEFGKNLGCNSHWFPNVRENKVLNNNQDNNYNKKLVFISRVDKEKGILLLTECLQELGEDYTLDIYGPINQIHINDLNGKNYNYKGCLSPTEVPFVLSQYDILCLPTNWDGEGYPGIIIEAFSVGKPIISTYKGGIPELIKDGYNGFLIEPNNKEELKQAILKVNNINYKSLSKNSLFSFRDFNAEIINPKIIETIINL